MDPQPDSDYISADKLKEEEFNNTVLDSVLGNTDSSKGSKSKKSSSKSQKSGSLPKTSSKSTKDDSSESSDNIFSSSDEECFSFGAHAFVLTLVLTIIFLIICLPCVDSWMGCYFDGHNYRVGMKTLLFFILTLIIVWVFMWKCQF